MSNTDNNFEKQLIDADQSLLSPGRAPDGSVIRRRSEQRKVARRQRRAALSGAIALIAVLACWRFMMPDGPDDQPNQLAGLETEPSIEQLKDEIESLVRDRQHVEQQLILLQQKTDLKRLELGIDRFARTERSHEAIYRRDRDAWQVLQQFAGDSKGAIDESDRWQFELLANGFPDTRAGTVALSILMSNQIPKSLNEWNNDL